MGRSWISVFVEMEMAVSEIVSQSYDLIGKVLAAGGLLYLSYVLLHHHQSRFYIPARPVYLHRPQSSAPRDSRTWKPCCSLVQRWQGSELRHEPLLGVQLSSPAGSSMVSSVLGVRKRIERWEALKVAVILMVWVGLTWSAADSS